MNKIFANVNLIFLFLFLLTLWGYVSGIMDAELGERSTISMHVYGIAPVFIVMAVFGLIKKYYIMPLITVILNFFCNAGVLYSDQSIPTYAQYVISSHTQDEYPLYTKELYYAVEYGSVFFC